MICNWQYYENYFLDFTLSYRISAQYCYYNSTATSVMYAKLLCGRTWRLVKISRKQNYQVLLAVQISKPGAVLWSATCLYERFWYTRYYAYPCIALTSSSYKQKSNGPMFLTPNHILCTGHSPLLPFQFKRHPRPRT